MSSAHDENTRTALVTGSSRGIGAATAKLLAAEGYTVVVNYRQKAKRADQIVAAIVAAGGQAITAQADITDPASRAQLFSTIADRIGHLDLLVLNASGGMESNMPDDYALTLNRDAQIALVDAALPLLRNGSRIVFVTSHQAHFVRTARTLPEYLPVAESKRAGEDALRARIPELTQRGVDVVVISGDMIVGTITASLLNRLNPGVIEERKEEVGKLYSVEEFAAEIVDAAEDPVPADHTKLVGNVDEFIK